MEQDGGNSARGGESNLQNEENADEDVDFDCQSPPEKRPRVQGDGGRCSKQSSKKKYSQKRKFAGNRHTAAKPKQATAISLKKVKRVKKEKKKSVIEGYRIVDMDILQTLINTLAWPECQENNLLLEEEVAQKKGLSSLLRISCTDCEFTTSSYTSKTVNESESRGLKPFEVNTRSVYAFRNIGVGHKGIERFCGLMNIPQPITVVAYNKISDNITTAAEEVAVKSMKAGTQEAVDFNKGSTDIGVSVDGTWQRRGYVSLNGVIVAISIDVGKILDVEIMSRYCRQCNISKRTTYKDDDIGFQSWYQEHEPECNLNHDGTAPAMECAGALRIFERSIEDRGVRYTKYYGDGDSKGYAIVCRVYGDDIILEKYECIGHYQKRVGTRLLKLKKNTKGLKELTRPIIDKLQNYFGIALRSNVKSVEAMQKAIFASFLHVASSKENNWHYQCDSSWCQYQRDQKNKTNLYKPGKGLPLSVVKLVRPIYMDLINPTELAKCLHGKTQNQNESFNSTVWERIPKNTYVGLQKLRLGVYDAVANFNDGRQGALDILRKLGINPGYYTTTSCFMLNKRRRLSAKYKSTDSVKKARKIIRAQKKLKSHTQKKGEGKTYKKGGF